MSPVFPFLPLGALLIPLVNMGEAQIHAGEFPAAILYVVTLLLYPQP